MVILSKAKSKSIIVFMVLSFLFTTVKAQTDSINYNHRKKVIWSSSAIAYTAGMTGLYQLWYKDYPQTAFHFFNDNAEWQKQDKLGHIGTAYYLSNWMGKVFSYAGYDNKKSALLGTLTGYGFQLTIEVFDGFSDQWGFSYGDLTANTIGAGLYYFQQVKWEDQRIKYKFSYHPTDYPQYNPSLLGENFSQQIFKDYNGQTYWLSFNVKSLIIKNDKVPEWLNIAVGYNAEGMTGARENREYYNGKAIPKFERIHSFVLSPDIDITKIKSKRKSINVLKEVFGFVKFPLPALQYKSNGKLSGKMFYF
jgi:hypothetical protein